MDSQTNLEVAWYHRANEVIRQQHLRQSEIAEFVGVSERSISHYLTGKQRPKPEVLAKIANALGTSLDWLMTGKHTATMRTPEQRPHVPFITNKAIIPWVMNGEANEGVVIIESFLPVTNDRCYYTDVPDGAMAGEFPKNSVVLVDPLATPDDGDIVIMKESADGAALVRRLAIAGDRKYLMAVDQKYPTIEVLPNFIYCGAILYAVVNYRSAGIISQFDK